MEFVNCIVCNSEKNFKLVQSVPDRFNCSNLYNILECDCGMVMLNPRPNIKQISKHYDVLDYQPHHKSNGVLDILYKIGQFFNNRSKLSIIKKYFSKGRLLDFGGGDGQFSQFMIKNKWDVMCYEPYLKKEQNKHINSINNLDSNSFDIITMFHSIEHIHDIHNSLDKIYNLLEGQGRLVLSFPNYNAYEKRFFNERWIPYDAPRHLYHFNLDSIKKILEQKNFEIIMSKPVYLDTLYNIIMSSNKSYKRILIAPFQIVYSIYNIFINKKVASTVFLVCRKK